MIEWGDGAYQKCQTAMSDALTLELIARGCDGEVRVVEVWPDAAGEGRWGCMLACGSLQWSVTVSAIEGNSPDFFSRLASRLLDRSPLTGKP